MSLPTRHAAGPSETGDADDVPTAGLGRLALAAIAGGALTGLFAAAFHACLDAALAVHAALVSGARAWPAGGWMLPVLASAALAAAARMLVRWVPEAAGSGIQRLEAYVRGEIPAASPKLLPVKFAGGVLALGSGLALGREGPTVQMGAVLGQSAARRLRLGLDDLRTVVTACGGAGLAVAFNAPFAGALFVIEEVLRKVNLRIAIAALLACGVAVGLSRWLVGNRYDFVVDIRDLVGLRPLFVMVLLGAILGVLGAVYNRGTFAAIDVLSRLRAPPELVAAVVAGTLAFVAWWVPGAAGPGEAETQAILGGAVGAGTLALLWVVRCLAGPLSYATGAPGGLFAPLLFIGTAASALLATPLSMLAPGSGLTTAACAVVGMAAFFAAVVRAPLTGTIIALEMTGASGLVLPMFIASATAALVASALGSPPVYQTLRERMLQAGKADRQA